MLTRFARVIIGIVLVITLPLTFIPSLVIWAITKRMYLNEVCEWCVLGDEYKRK